MLEHSHVFGQDRVRPGERRTIVVIAITAVMMVVEIAAGLAYGSMALLADGLHMGSHAVALTVAAVAYIYARRHAHDRRYTFGTGKVNPLGGFAGAVLLAVFAVFMAYESIHRLLEPTPIGFNQAILVAILGLVVNAICAFVLRGHHDRHHRGEALHEEPGDAEAGDDHDHNLRSAYLHVIADALTSVTAILALLTGKYLGWTWMDPVMGIVGSLLVGSWSVGLIRATSAVLLDHQAPPAVTDRLRGWLEADADVRVTDLHVWSIGPDIYAAAITVASPTPRRPDYYKEKLVAEPRLVHVTVEVHPT